MATVYNCYQHYVYTAIHMLMEKGFIRSDLDWDVNRGKFTLRLFGVDDMPLKVIIIWFRRKEGVIVVSDAKTHENTEFHIVFEDAKNKAEFHKFIIDRITEM